MKYSILHHARYRIVEISEVESSRVQRARVANDTGLLYRAPRWVSIENRRPESNENGAVERSP